MKATMLIILVAAFAKIFPPELEEVVYTPNYASKSFAAKRFAQPKTSCSSRCTKCKAGMGHSLRCDELYAASNFGSLEAWRQQVAAWQDRVGLQTTCTARLALITVNDVISSLAWENNAAWENSSVRRGDDSNPSQNLWCRRQGWHV